MFCLYFIWFSFLCICIHHSKVSSCTVIFGGYFSHPTDEICALNRVLHCSICEFSGVLFYFPGLFFAFWVWNRPDRAPVYFCPWSWIYIFLKYGLRILFILSFIPSIFIFLSQLYCAGWKYTGGRFRERMFHTTYNSLSDRSNGIAAV